MNQRLLGVFGCIVLAAACGEAPQPEATEAQPGTTVPATAGPSFLALHLYNPGSDSAHEELLGGLSDLNEAVAEAGHPETRYAVWRVTGEQAGDYAYLFGSVWADRSTYDAVHGHEAYTTVMSALEESGVGPMEDETYNRYEELSPRVADPSPMPEGGATFLALHLFNLPSADAEAELIAILEDFNAAVASAGHPETRYTLWKVTGEQSGDRSYLFGSLWADRAAYDAVHEDPAYQSMAETHGDAYRTLVLDEVYNQYELVTGG
jgi:quinol monooxygenase YgiN